MLLGLVSKRLTPVASMSGVEGVLGDRSNLLTPLPFYAYCELMKF